MRLIDADALMAQFSCTCGCKHCGRWRDGILPCDIKDKIKEAPTVIDCGEMDHEELGKIPYMDLRPRMTKEKCDEITEKIRRLFLNGGNLYVDVVNGRNEEQQCHVVACLLDFIASLHNELYKQVFGEYYDYMYHWANLGYDGNPNDALFKDAEEVKKDDT